MESKKSSKPDNGTAESIPVKQDANGKADNILDDLFKVEQGTDYLPGQWKKRRKRKTKRRSSGL